MSPKVKPLSLAIATLIAGGAFSALQVSPVFAQAAPTQAGVVGRVDVTGTNIRRTDSETSSEVQVITREQMVQSGYTSVSQVLRDLTANSNGTIPGTASRSFAAGASAVSLRGLTVSSTLVLIDGLRMAGYPRADDAQRSFVDISSIPFVAVDRIEVLLDGASAIYGADAIAGVVNVILKKDFKGTYAMGSGGTSTKGGGTTWNGQIQQGFGDVSQGFGGYAALEFRSQQSIQLSQRSGEPWNINDYTPFGGNDLRPGAKSAFVANPRTKTPYLQNPNGSANLPANNAFLDANCDLTRRNNNQCLYEDTWSQIQPRTQNVNFVLALAGKLNNDWTYDLKGTYFDSQSTGVIASPAAATVNSYAGALTGGPNQNPLVGVNAIPVVRAPANYPGNPFGVAATMRALLPELRTRSITQDVGASRLVGQLFGASWGWDISAAAGFTNVRQTQQQNGFISVPNFNKAINDPVNPYLLTGGNSTALANFVMPSVNNVNWQSLSFAQVAATRDLMQLQGGPLSIAIGAGDFYKNLSAPNAGAGQDGTVSILGATTYAVGSQNNANVYAEVLAPVLKGLEIEAAIRYDSYNKPNANTWNPKVGVKWTPIQQLALRGTAGTGFRAPSINESGNSGSTFNSNAIRDTLNCPANLPGTTNPDNNSPQNVQGTCSFNPAYLQQGNKNVKPEKSDTLTAGFILEPVKGWSTTFDYYYIKLKDQIINSSALSTFSANPSNTVRNAPQLVTFGDGHTGISPAGLVAYISAPFVNAQQIKTDGFDLSTGYTWKLPDNSTLLTSATWNHVLSYDLQADGITYKLAGTHGPTAISGDTGTPKDRAQGTIQWAKGPWTATAMVNYIGRFNVTDPSAGNTTCQQALLNTNASGRWTNTNVAANYCNVASFTFVNLNVQYQWNKQWTFTGSLVNAFNAKAPVDMETYGTSAGQTIDAGNSNVPYNPSFHQVGAVGPFWSLGFIYTFN